MDLSSLRESVYTRSDRSQFTFKRSHSDRCCGASYLGQTRRHLHTRISEHMGVSPLTGKKRATHSLSSVLTHTHRTGHSISPDDFTIVSSCRSSSNFELLRGSLLISKLKPPLNENISSTPSSVTELQGALSRFFWGPVTPLAIGIHFKTFISIAFTDSSGAP